MKNTDSLLKIYDNSIAIIGFEEGAAGQTQAWLESYGLYQVACFVYPEKQLPTITKIKRSVSQFDYPDNNLFKGRPLYTEKNWPEKIKKLGIKKVLVHLSDKRRRILEIERAKKSGLELINAIHPTVTISNDVILGENIILMANVFIGYRTEILDGVQINTGSQIDHHNYIMQGTTIDPGVVTAGNVTIGKFSQVHTGAIIINRINLGENSILGAGAVVIKNVLPNQTVAGNPARPI